MKKKAALIAIVLVICSVLGVVANGLQKKMVSKQAADKNKVAESINSSSEEKSNESTPDADAKKQADSSSTQTNTNNQTNTSNNGASKNTSSTAGTSSSSKSATGSNNSGNTKPQPQTGNNNSGSGTSTKTNTQAKAPDNFFIINGITGQTIYSSKEDLSGKDAGKITKDILRRQGISNSIDTTSGYVSMMAGLKERAQGSMSGWGYYVNGMQVIHLRGSI